MYGGIAIFTDGLHIAVKRCGRGKDLVMLHGYMSCKESFYNNIPAFSGNFCVTAPDFPGFGASSPIPRGWSVGDYAAWLEKFMAASGIEGAYLLAHSFGARVAIKFAAERPRLVKAMVITGGAGIVKPRSRAYMRKVRAYRFVKKFAPRYAERAFGSEEYRSLAPVMRESYKKIVNEDLRAYAARVRCPVLLVYGSGDTVTPAAEEGLAFAAAMPRACLKIIGGGHFCFMQNSEIFNAEAAAFLGGLRET